MKKILFMIIFALMVFSATAYAEDATGKLPDFDVLFNGQVIESDYREYPLIVYKNITYVPMTYYDCRYLGLTTNWDNETQTFSVSKENITCVYRDSIMESANKNKMSLKVCDFNIVVNGKSINNSAEEYPLVTFRGVTYFPLTWRFAVDEFGWAYSFDPENGLVINSSNPHTQIINLPNISGSAAFDGEYYYYNGKIGENNYVYSAFHETPDNAYILHQLPNTPLARAASFEQCDSGIYISYISGYSPVMSTKQFYKINGGARTVEQDKPDAYEYYSHGYSEVRVQNNEISVFCENPLFDSATKISYTKNGQTYEVPALPGRVRVGCGKINGLNYDVLPLKDCIKILGDKIYFMAFDYETGDYQGGIYVVDTSDNTVKKIIEKADGAFHVYSGWVSAMSPNSNMIIYGKDGSLYRYVEENDKSSLIYDGSQNTNMILCGATGVYDIYACLQSIDGSKTVVLSSFGAYADGYGRPEEVFSTNTGTSAFLKDGKLVVATVGESPNDDVRMLVVGTDKVSGNTIDFRTSDACTGVFVYDTYLLYKAEGKTVRVNLE